DADERGFFQKIRPHPCQSAYIRVQNALGGVGGNGASVRKSNGRGRVRMSTELFSGFAFIRVNPRSSASKMLLAFFAVLALHASESFGADLQPIPPLTARVTDTTGTLDASQKQTLETSLATLEQRKGAQLAVLIVPTVKPEEIEQYSIRVVDAWKLGRKSVDDGVLLIVAKND